MSGFIEMLEKLNARDTRVRAVLRRSLAFDPGAYPDAFPYVEPFVRGNDDQWRREMLYLAAGLWAAHWRAGRSDPQVSLGKACALHQLHSKSQSVERRFINLLDADDEQLPYRLRHMVTLLKEHNIDFESLLNGLLFWRSEKKGTQNQWAREFYRSLNSTNISALGMEETE